jgi:RNA polymerase sigma-70 factor (ECF subfamily)
MGVAAEDPLGDLERFRPYLRLLADAGADARLRGKLDLSGVVQQTLWEAHKDRHQLHKDRHQLHLKGAGVDEGIVLAWLRRILLRNLLDELRRLRRKSADLARERSLEDSSARLAAELEASDSSPSAHAAHNERAFRIAAALEQLPADQRIAVIRHHLHGVPLAAIAEELDRSKEAVAGLLHRGLVRLRGLLKDDTPD